MRSLPLLAPRASIFVLLQIVILFVVSCGWATGQVAPTGTQPLELHGLVKSGNSPMRGAKVDATDPVSGNKVVGWTDLDGSFVLPVPAAGHYAVTVEMPAFGPLSHDVIVDANSGRADFDLVLLS